MLPGDKNIAHTPGPWMLRECEDAVGIYEVVDEVGTRVLAQCDNIVEDDQGQANARLIAAAPALLETMYEAANIQHLTSQQRGEIDCTEQALCIFCAAITQATGQG